MRVLVLAATTGYQTRSFADAAEKLGVSLAFATDRCHVLDDPWQDEAIPIRFHREAAAVAAILKSAASRPIDGVIAVGDRPTTIAAKAARALGLAWHTPAGTAVSRNKRLARRHLRGAGLPVPWFRALPLADDPDDVADVLPYPCVIKPAALSASRGVMRVNDPREFVQAFGRLRALLRSADVLEERNPAHEVALVERFIPGREFAIEAVMHHGVLHPLAIFDKPDPLDGPYFEETIYVTPSAADAAVQDAMSDAVGRAASAMGLAHGPIHGECRVNPDGVFVLEVAARPIGGLCARALRFVSVDDGRPETAISLEELLMRHALGESPARWRREPEASGVMMIPIPARGVFRGVDGEAAARDVPGIVDVRITAKPDQVLVPLPEGASYLGFIFARAAAPEAVDAALREAHARLRFAIDPQLRVLQSHHG